MDVSAGSRARCRFPRGRIIEPWMISPCVILVVNTVVGPWTAIHSTTFAAGASFISSERTLVSRTIIGRSWAAREWDHGRAAEARSPQGAESGADRVGQVDVRDAVFRQGGPQEGASLLFHGAPILGRANPQPPLRPFVELPDGGARHVQLAVQSLFALKAMLAFGSSLPPGGHGRHGEDDQAEGHGRRAEWP